MHILPALKIFWRQVLKHVIYLYYEGLLHRYHFCEVFFRNAIHQKLLKLVQF